MSPWVPNLWLPKAPARTQRPATEVRACPHRLLFLSLQEGLHSPGMGCLGVTHQGHRDTHGPTPPAFLSQAVGHVAPQPGPGLPIQPHGPPPLLLLSGHVVSPCPKSGPSAVLASQSPRGLHTGGPGSLALGSHGRCSSKTGPSGSPPSSVQLGAACGQRCSQQSVPAPLSHHPYPCDEAAVPATPMPLLIAPLSAFLRHPRLHPEWPPLGQVSLVIN